MSKYSYMEIVKQATLCHDNTKKYYKNGISTKWAYYIGQAILKPNKDIAKVKHEKATNPTGEHISRQISKKDYLEIIKHYNNYIEKNHQIPNYITIDGKKVKPKLYTAFVSYILYKYHRDKKLPAKQNINSKIYTKPVETTNEVYNYACKKYGKTFKTLDDILEYVAKNFTYEFYYDDHKSNKQVTDSKAGNCTDLLQWLTNMVEPLGYSWKCIHVQCRQSGTGHVFGKFKHPKNTSNEWVVRDIACCADNGSISCVWCRDGYVLAENPSWWIQNRNR